jgi:hypothetical protein
MYKTSWTIKFINQYIKLKTKLKLMLNELADLLFQVTSLERKMMDQLNTTVPLDRTSLKNFAKMVVSPAATSVEELLDRIHVLTTGFEDFVTFGSEGVLRMVVNEWNVSMKTV